MPSSSLLLLLLYLLSCLILAPASIHSPLLALRSYLRALRHQHATTEPPLTEGMDDDSNLDKFFEDFAPSSMATPDSDTHKHRDSEAQSALTKEEEAELARILLGDRAVRDLAPLYRTSLSFNQLVRLFDFKSLVASMLSEHFNRVFPRVDTAESSRNNNETKLNVDEICRSDIVTMPFHQCKEFLTRVNRDDSLSGRVSHEQLVITPKPSRSKKVTLQDSIKSSLEKFVSTANQDLKDAFLKYLFQKYYESFKEEAEKMGSYQNQPVDSASSSKLDINKSNLNANNKSNIDHRESNFRIEVNMSPRNVTRALGAQGSINGANQPPYMKTNFTHKFMDSRVFLPNYRLNYPGGTKLFYPEIKSEGSKNADFYKSPGKSTWVSRYNDPIYQSSVSFNSKPEGNRMGGVSWHSSNQKSLNLISHSQPNFTILRKAPEYGGTALKFDIYRTNRLNFPYKQSRRVSSRLFNSSSFSENKNTHFLAGSERQRTFTHKVYPESILNCEIKTIVEPNIKEFKGLKDFGSNVMYENEIVPELSPQFRNPFNVKFSEDYKGAQGAADMYSNTQRVINFNSQEHSTLLGSILLVLLACIFTFSLAGVGWCLYTRRPAYQQTLPYRVLASREDIEEGVDEGEEENESETIDKVFYLNKDVESQACGSTLSLPALLQNLTDPSKVKPLESAESVTQTSQFSKPPTPAPPPPPPPLFPLDT